MPQKGKVNAETDGDRPKTTKKAGPRLGPRQGRDGQQTCSNWLLYSSA